MNPIAQVLKEIRPEFDYDTSDNFIADGMLDSFDIVTLVSTLDSKYGISIDGADIIPENLHSVAAIAALLQKYGVTP